jgi:transposase-like protein
VTKRTRRKFPPALKARICIEAIREEKSLGELATEFEVHANVIRSWKKQFLERASELFQKGKEKSPAEDREPELFKQIGQMKVENDWLKKKLGLLDLI